MFESYIRLVAVVASAFVVVSFGMFAIDETRTASATSRAQIAANDEQLDPGQREAARRARPPATEHNVIRRSIDSVNDVVVAPFNGVVSAHGNVWAKRGVPALLALLCFGLGLGFVARYRQGRSS